jgi:hypothetical protein
LAQVKQTGKTFVLQVISIWAFLFSIIHANFFQN